MCVGDPEAWTPDAVMGSLCPAEGTVSLLQLRPSPADELHPAVWWLTACPRHQRAVRQWLRNTWAHDDVDTYGTRFLVDVQDRDESLLEDLGADVWRMTPAMAG